MQIVSPFFAPYRQKKEDFFMYGKKTGKRLLSWVLVLIMALSMLPHEFSGEGTDVVYGYDTGNGWVRNKNSNGTDPITNVEGVDSVSKTAVPTGNPNEYRVKLEVQMHTTTTAHTSYAQAATVLVIDTSGSMGEGCQKWWHTHNSNCPLPLEGCQGCGHQFP